MTMLLLTLQLVTVGLFAVLLAFAVRRLVFLVTLLRPQPPLASPATPEVLILLPARNEEASLPGLIAAVDQLDYPRERLRVVLINDGSTDRTGRLMAEAAARRNWSALNLPLNVGKPQALNLALEAHTFGEIVYIFDADHRPRPDCVREGVRAFGDPQVAGMSGRTVPNNTDASAVAYYATIESLVHQLITMRGKDVLRLGPALLGSNNAYRRSSLRDVGGFRPGTFLEDSDLTLFLYRAGYTVRYVTTATAALEVPFTVAGFIRQHLRWGRGFNDVARIHLPALLRDGNLPVLMRLELALFAVGYLDRLALLGMIGILAMNVLLGQPTGLPLLGIALNLGLPFLQIVAALAFDRAPLSMWLRLPLVPLFFGLDAAIAVWSMVLTLLNRPRVWTQTERAPG